MAKESQKTYQFSFLIALWIALLSTIFLLLIEYFFFQIEWISILFFLLGVFVISFLMIQTRAEQFIYKNIKKIYKNVSLLSDSSLQEDQVTTDMSTLKRNVEKFAENKKLEIEALKIREDYRREFVGNISHELKTPLFTVQGYILTLLDGAKDNEKLTEKYLKRANKGVERLIYIVKDLDMITKLEAGELRLKPEYFDIIEVITTVFDLLDIKAEEKKISLTFDHPYKNPIYVEADKERIQQVITNLVVNSIKYGKEKGTTEIGVENFTENKVIVRITDNGEGFKKEDIPRLFERFFRLDKSGSRKEGGSGLGLSIVKHVLEAHQEQIYVESDYGIGSEFSFTLKKGNKPVSVPEN